MSPIVEPDPQSEVLAPIVDELGWGDSDREVVAYARRATSPGGPFARSLAPEGVELLSRLRHPTIHAAEVSLEESQHQLLAVVREAVVVTNGSRAPVTSVSLRLLGNGRGGPDQDQALVLGAWVEGLAAHWLLRGTVLNVALPAVLPPGRAARLLLEVVERVPPSDARQPVTTEALWADQTGSFAVDDGVVVLGGLLPVVFPLREDGTWDTRTLAAEADPAEGDLALFRVSLTAPARYAVASTGVSVGRVTDGRSTTELLVAGAARDFSMVLVPGGVVARTQVGGTALRVITAGDQAELVATDLQRTAEDAIRAMSARFGAPSVAELDVVDAPARAVAGLDWPGLVVVNATHQGRPWHETAQADWALAHGIAHQWWGHEVASDGLLDPWIDEGLAEHGASLYWEAAHGREALLDRDEVEVLELLADLRRRGYPDRPAILPADAYDRTELQAIVHGRSALFLDELRRRFGEERWTAALRALRAEGTLDPERFLDALRSVAPEGVDVDALFERWMAEGHAYEDLLGPR